MCKPLCGQRFSKADTLQHMSEDSSRSVHITRTGAQSFTVTNARGATLQIGEGQNDDFTPVELLLAAIGGCNAVTVEALTKRSEPEQFDVDVHAQKTKSADGGTQLEDIRVTFAVEFPDDEPGRKMTERLPGAIEKSHRLYCTVGRTVEPGTPIAIELLE